MNTRKKTTLASATHARDLKSAIEAVADPAMVKTDGRATTIKLGVENNGREGKTTLSVWLPKTIRDELKVKAIRRNMKIQDAVEDAIIQWILSKP